MEKTLLIFVLFTLMEYIESCAIQTDRPIEEVIKQNLDSPWLVLIMDNRKKAMPPGIGYGSIINEHYVLTAAKAVSDHKVERLVLMSDCEMNSHSSGTFLIESCVYRRVFLIYYENSVFPKMVKDDYWALLSVNKPFELTKRVNTIPLINDNNIDDIDKNNCLVYHWAIAVNKEDSAFVTMKYSVASDEEGFKINEKDKQRFNNDFDCILDPCEFETAHEETNSQSMSFMGSPIACQRKSDPTKHIQAGFATIIYRLYQQHPLEYDYLNGNLYDLTSKQESLNELVSRLKNLRKKGKKR